MKEPFLLAKEICQTLVNEGYIAYFAGGWVRDFLMGHSSQEIDIATNAPPPVIQKIFTKTIAVGIQFGVVVVVLGGMNFEVTTFRQEHAYNDGRHPEVIEFSTPIKDAERRDFTINGMFYDPLTKRLYDFVEGEKDVKKKLIRAIGKPAERFSEDRLRMVRAVRFAARFNFLIEEETAAALTHHASSLFPSVSMERIWQELCKMAASPYFDRALLMLHHFGLLQTIFPQLEGYSTISLEERVTPFSEFPKTCPCMAYLLELFPSSSLEERVALCFYLKTSAQERKLVQFFGVAEELFKNPKAEAVKWAYFYAHPFSELFLQIQRAKLPLFHKASFTAEHQERRKALEKHIERIQLKKPLVTASHLQKLGVPQSEQMGALLKVAERLVINENLSTAEEALKLINLHPAQDD